MQNITKMLAAELGCSEKYIQNVIDLLDEGNTIPFIARYCIFSTLFSQLME